MVCIRCHEHDAIDDDTLCGACVMLLTHRAAGAYDDIRRRGRINPKAEPDRIVQEALLLINVGHELHHIAFIGCPFCVWGP